jgi:hypothetical protein
MAALQGSLFRRLAGLMTALLILFQTSCATQPYAPSLDLHAPSLDLHLKLQTQRIALVPARFQVDEDLELFARGRLAGIGKGVGNGAGKGALVTGSGVSRGDALLLLILIPIALVVGGTIGGVMGALAATPKEEAERMERTIHEALEQFSVHMDLSKKVLSEANSIDGLTMELVPGPADAQKARDYQRHAAEGFDSVLEICVHQIEFGEGKGKDPELALHIVVDACLVDVGTGAETYAQVFDFVGSRQRFSEWAAEDGETIERKFDEALEKLAIDIVNNFFVDFEAPKQESR